MATPTKYSLWLLPTPEATRTIQDIIKQLSKRFHTPVFGPHATLVPGLTLPLKDIMAATMLLAERQSGITAPVKDTVMTDAFFRALFMEMEPLPAFSAYRQQIIQRLKVSPSDKFRPHVSLLYSDAPQAEKEKVLSKVIPLLPSTLSFTEVSVVRTTGPVEDWENMAIFRFNG